jgi:neuraminidase-like protein
MLYVIGRTHSPPHKYFHRSYAHQMWTPWKPINTDIDGDHVITVLWRNRLSLFWLHFSRRQIRVEAVIQCVHRQSM